MSRGTKGIVLLALLAGIAVCVRMLALGRETVWMPLLSGSAARLVFRSLTIALGLAAWFVSQSLIGARALCEGGIGDAVHEWTAPLNAWFGRNRGAANALLITTSGFIDLFAAFLLGSALFGPSLRPGIALLLLFLFRQISQLTCALPTPSGMIWRHPGIPSLLVTYDVATDFFFSGHDDDLYARSQSRPSGCDESNRPLVGCAIRRRARSETQRRPRDAGTLRAKSSQ